MSESVQFQIDDNEAARAEKNIRSIRYQVSPTLPTHEREVAAQLEHQAEELRNKAATPRLGIAHSQEPNVVRPRQRELSGDGGHAVLPPKIQTLSGLSLSLEWIPILQTQSGESRGKPKRMRASGTGLLARTLDQNAIGGPPTALQ